MKYNVERMSLMFLIKNPASQYYSGLQSGQKNLLTGSIQTKQNKSPTKSQTKTFLFNIFVLSEHYRYNYIGNWNGFKFKSS